MIYTSYFGRLRDLSKSGIEAISISRSVPTGFAGRRIMELAPTWAMLKMSDEDYDRCYEQILAKVDRDELVKSFEGRNVALLCWEKDINDCHRKRVGEWLREGGYEVEEFQTERQIQDEKRKEEKRREEAAMMAQRQVSMWEILSMV